jgi:hypothetical protein
MLELEKRIKDLIKENKSLKFKAIMFGLFSISQTLMLLIEKYQDNIFTFGGIILMALGVAVLSITSLLMIKFNNKLIQSYKKFK